MAHEERALQLIERLYEAVVEPESWKVFLEDLSKLLGGAAIQLSLRLPETPPTADAYYRVGLDETYHPAFLKHALEEPAWESLDTSIYLGRFGLVSELAPEEDIEDTGFYHDYMKPQGLAPEWPISHIICTDQHHPIASVIVYRRKGCRPIDTEDLRLLDALVPHLARAYSIFCQLSQVQQEHKALTEVIDRLPIGVLLVDAEGRATLMNHSLEEILALGDGFELEAGRPRAESPRENRALQALISKAVKMEVLPARPAGGVMSLPRPSGKRAFPVMVGPLLAASPDNPTNEAKAMLFIGNPEGEQIGTTDVLESLYQLTRAEAELVRLIAEGRSLEQVAAERGVTMNTVRSQLKQVFAKTDTSRQGELVHLVLTGIASIRDKNAS